VGHGVHRGMHACCTASTAGYVSSICWGKGTQLTKGGKGAVALVVWML
jgi:hypothetical protein